MISQNASGVWLPKNPAKNWFLQGCANIPILWVYRREGRGVSRYGKGVSDKLAPNSFCLIKWKEMAIYYAIIKKMQLDVGSEPPFSLHVRNSDVQIRTSRIRIQTPRIRIQTNPNPAKKSLNPDSILDTTSLVQNTSGSPEFFKKYSLPCASWCILRLGGAYCALMVHNYPIYHCSSA